MSLLFDVKNTKNTILILLVNNSQQLTKIRDGTSDITSGDREYLMSTLPAARKTALRPREIVNQNRFGKRAYIVGQLRLMGSTLSTKALWALVSQAL